jgi:hypothetical protein
MDPIFIRPYIGELIYNLYGSSRQGFGYLMQIRIRIQLFTSMRIRILLLT